MEVDRKPTELRQIACVYLVVLVEILEEGRNVNLACLWSVRVKPTAPMGLSGKGNSTNLRHIRHLTKND
ncbi:MAG: hypothetical protein QMB16_06015 [Paracoccaceae bacterium]